MARDLNPGAPPVTVRGTAAIAGVSATVAERILAPLLDNARRYATRTVTVETAQLPGLVRVTVRDDGPGVPAHLNSCRARSARLRISGETSSVGNAAAGRGVGTAEHR